MDIFEAIQSRRSVKHYDPHYKIPQEHVDQLLQLAITSPTSYNIQNWRLLWVQDKALRSQIKEAAYGQEQVTSASLLLLLCADTKAWDKDPDRYWRHAPQATQETIAPMIRHFYKNNIELQRDEAIRSVGIISQTLMLAAKGMGYDSCPMIGFDPHKIANIICLPQDYLIGMMLVIGKATKEAWPRIGKLPLEEVVFKDRFSS